MLPTNGADWGLRFPTLATNIEEGSSTPLRLAQNDIKDGARDGNVAPGPVHYRCDSRMGVMMLLRNL